MFFWRAGGEEDWAPGQAQASQKLQRIQTWGRQMGLREKSGPEPHEPVGSALKGENHTCSRLRW